MLEISFEFPFENSGLFTSTLAHESCGMIYVKTLGHNIDFVVNRVAESTASFLSQRAFIKTFQ